jgi:hypothetical protein
MKISFIVMIRMYLWCLPQLLETDYYNIVKF